MTLNWRDPVAHVYADHDVEFATALALPIPVRALWGVHDAYVRGLLSHTDLFRVESFADGIGWERPGADEQFASASTAGLTTRLRELRAFVADSTKTASRPWLLWVRDGSPFVRNEAQPSIAATLLREIAEVIYHGKSKTRILVTGSKCPIQRELGWLVSDIQLTRPSVDKLQPLVQELMTEFAHERDELEVDRVCELLRGLDVATSAHVVRVALAGKPKQLVAAVEERRNEHLKTSKAISVVASTKSIDDIGGLHGFRGWLTSKTEVIMAREEARADGVQLPRGVLLAGVPGCGKSLAAQVMASFLAMPLLRLDVAKLFGRFLGESEYNLDEALQIAESAAPCVLWIDELEKALATNDGAHEVTVRMVGSLLTWMQERPGRSRDVLVVATANAVSQLPPELLRRGRFDEFFYFGLPEENDRREIADRALNQINERIRKARVGSDETPPSWKLSEDAYKEILRLKGTGADIEALVEQSVEYAFSEGRKPNAEANAGMIDADVVKLLAAKIRPLQGEASAIVDELKKQGFRNANEPLPSEQNRRRRNLEQLNSALRMLVAPGEPLTLDWNYKDKIAQIRLAADRYSAIVRGETLNRPQRFRVLLAGNTKTGWFIKLTADDPGQVGNELSELRVEWTQFQGIAVRTRKGTATTVNFFRGVSRWATKWPANETGPEITFSIRPPYPKAPEALALVEAGVARAVCRVIRCSTNAKPDDTGSYWLIDSRLLSEEVRSLVPDQILVGAQGKVGKIKDRSFAIVDLGPQGA